MTARISEERLRDTVELSELNGTDHYLTKTEQRAICDELLSHRQALERAREAIEAGADALGFRAHAEYKADPAPRELGRRQAVAHYHEKAAILRSLLSTTGDGK